MYNEIALRTFHPLCLLCFWWFSIDPKRKEPSPNRHPKKVVLLFRKTPSCRSSGRRFLLFGLRYSFNCNEKFPLGRISRISTSIFSYSNYNFFIMCLLNVQDWKHNGSGTIVVIIIVFCCASFYRPSIGKGRNFDGNCAPA